MGFRPTERVLNNKMSLQVRVGLVLLTSASSDVERYLFRRQVRANSCEPSTGGFYRAALHVGGKRGPTSFLPPDSFSTARKANHHIKIGNASRHGEEPIALTAWKRFCRSVNIALLVGRKYYRARNRCNKVIPRRLGYVRKPLVPAGAVQRAEAGHI
jgi:hypothetical protein